MCSCHTDPSAANWHVLRGGTSCCGEGLEAAQDPHPLPTHRPLDLKPTRASGDLL